MFRQYVDCNSRFAHQLQLPIAREILELEASAFQAEHTWVAEVGTAAVGTWAVRHMAAAAFHTVVGRDTIEVDNLDWHILPDKAVVDSQLAAPHNDLSLLVDHLPV